MTTPIRDGVGDLKYASSAINPNDGGLIWSTSLTDPTAGSKQTVTALGQATVAVAPVSAPVLITPSDSVTVTPGTLGVGLVVTVAGNVKVGFANGVSWTVPVTPGYVAYPWAVNQVFATGTSATLSAYALF